MFTINTVFTLETVFTVYTIATKITTLTTLRTFGTFGTLRDVKTAHFIKKKPIIRRDQDHHLSLYPLIFIINSYIEY